MIFSDVTRNEENWIRFTKYPQWRTCSAWQISIFQPEIRKMVCFSKEEIQMKLLGGFYQWVYQPRVRIQHDTTGYETADWFVVIYMSYFPALKWDDDPLWKYQRWSQNRKIRPEISVVTCTLFFFFLTYGKSTIYGLVGGLEPWNFMTFHSVGNVIIQTDELTPSFFRGVGGSTTNQWILVDRGMVNPWIFNL